MARVETVKVVNPDDKDGGHMIINRADFKEGTHKLVQTKGEPADGQGYAAMEKNPSGTYSEPTPTDIRYPDKDATEFENNHGAFLRKSAAQIREDTEMPDEPGGIVPDGHVPEDVSKLNDAQKQVIAKRSTGNYNNVSDKENLDEIVKGAADKNKKMKAEQKDQKPAPAANKPFVNQPAGGMPPPKPPGT